MQGTPIHIALALDHFDPARGGSEAWVANFATWLIEKNYKVSIVATGGKPLGHIQVHTTAAPPHPWRRARALTVLASSLNPDLIHDTGVLLAADIFHPHTGSRTINLKREIAARLLVERTRLVLSPSLMRWRVRCSLLEHRQLSAAHRIIAPSRLSASDLRRKQSLDSSKIDIIPHGIPAGRFENMAPHARAQMRRKLGLNDEIMFLISAHNFLLKGVGTTIDALAAMTPEERQQVKIFVAGNGDIARYSRYARKQGVESRIIFLGPVADMAGLYPAADVALHPTFHDSCSLSTLEAIAAGLPVITTAFNGAADFIDHEKDGIILPSAHCPFLLATAIRHMLSGGRRAHYKKMLGNKAGLVSQDINFSRIEGVYRQILLERNST